MLVQSVRHAFKIQATDFGDVLARLAESFMILEQRIRVGVLFLQAAHISPKPSAQQNFAFRSHFTLLPGCQRSLAAIQ